MWAQYLRLNLHISATNRELVRAAFGLLSAKGKTRAMRIARHEWIKRMLECHEQAKKMMP